MPDGYEEIRLNLACGGLSHENTIDIQRARMAALGGRNYVTAEASNKMNEIRAENFLDYIKTSYPYIEIVTEKNNASSTEDMIEAYKKIFPQKQ